MCAAVVGEPVLLRIVCSEFFIECEELKLTQFIYGLAWPINCPNQPSRIQSVCALFNSTTTFAVSSQQSLP